MTQAHFRGCTRRSRPGAAAACLNLYHQRGATAIEFALVFPLFMALIYGMFSYTLVFMLAQSFTYASEDALRAALAVDCQGLSSQQCIDNRIAPAARSQVETSLAWLPDNVKDQVIGSGGNKVIVNCVSDTCTVEVRYPDYRSNPLMPLLTLPGIGTIPQVPQHLVGRASLRV